MPPSLSTEVAIEVRRDDTIEPATPLDTTEERLEPANEFAAEFAADFSPDAIPG